MIHYSFNGANIFYLEIGDHYHPKKYVSLILKKHFESRQYTQKHFFISGDYPLITHVAFNF